MFHLFFDDMRILLLVTLLFLGGCDYDRFAEPALVPPAMDWEPNTKVAELGEWVGKGEIAESLRVEFTVTSSDSAGNFYKELYGEDMSRALRLKLGVYDIYGLYGPGVRVRLLLRGLAVGVEDGCLVVGLASGMGVSYLGPEALIRGHLRRVDGAREDTPWPLVSSDLNTQYVGRYVEIMGEFMAGHWDEKAFFRDIYGGGVYVYTSPYASFYGRLLPVGRVRLRGIVVRRGGRLELCVSDAQSAISF